MEGARANLGYGFEVLELECIISFTFPGNAAPRRVMEKCASCSGVRRDGGS